MTNVSLPRSVRDYMHRRSIRKAVDHLIDAGSAELPEGLDDWLEVRAYHRAYLSACQVRGEHALLLMDLWDATWGEALDVAGKGWRPLSPDEQVEDGEPLPSPDHLWQEGHAFCRMFASKDGKSFLELGLDYWHDVGIRLFLAAMDENGVTTRSDDAVLLEPWETKVDEDGFRVTAAGFQVPSDEETTDASSLRLAAEGALRTVA